MSTIVTRAGKGSALTHTEVDANFTNLNTDKIQSGNTVAALTITSATIAGGTINGTTVGATTPSTGSFTSLTDSGNLTFTGTGNRITGDFSNATTANRVLFQTSTANTSTTFGIMPNGTGTNANFGSYGNALDLANTSVLFMGVTNSGAEARFNSAIAGTGTYLPMTFYTGGSERMRVDTSGNVGIGVTSTSGSKLFINGAALNDLTTFSTADAATTLLNNDNGAALGRATKVLFRNGNLNLAGIAGVYTGFNGAGDIAGALAFGTQTNVAGGITERMRIDSSGNVGIGTSSPVVPLDVVSPSNAIGAQIRGRTSDNISILRFVNNVSNVEYARIQAQSDAVSINAVVNGPLIMATNNAERARIDSSGNLLVGKTSDSNSAAGVVVANASGTIGTIKNVKTASGTYNSLLNYHNGTYVGGVDYSNTATSFPTSSDIRLKKDIVDAPSASAKIEQVRVVSHGWKHDEAVVEFGVIAQELYTVAPQAVTAGDDNEEVEKTWSVDYSKLVPLLIKAHQEQQVMIEELKAKVAALEEK
jgi:hypothetical protein